MKKEVVCGVLALVITACASHDVKTVNLLAPTSYAANASYEEVDVGADAYDSDAKTKAAFDEKLVRKGIYPVQVSIQNKSERSLLIVRSEIELAGPVTNAIRPMNSVEVAEAVENNAMAEAIFGFGILSYAAAKDANSEREADYANKQLPQELIIRPGRMGGGFVFFRMPTGEKLAGKTLRVPVQDAGSASDIVGAEVQL